ncbi:MAG: alpha/beta hydrolase [Oscillospiraceae bacterium]|nr:alpha/beta hydrolase [Oscillospiraceae bacterium]
MLYNAKNGVIHVDDHDMHYIRFGTGKKTMIMIPGVGDGFKTVKGTALPFAYAYRRFARDFTVYVFSRRENLPAGFTTQNMAEDTAKAMDILSIKSASIVGVSQGGMIAMHLAADYPEKIEKLVLAVTAACANETIGTVVTSWIDMAHRDEFKNIMIDSREKSYTEKYLKTYRMAYPFIPLMKPSSLDRFIIQAQSCLSHDATGKLGLIRCPVLVLGRAEDKIVTGDASRHIARSIPGSVLHIWPGYSHGVYEEAKDFNSRVLDFLE